MATDGAPSQGQAASQLSRDQIITATAQCLRESGYDATTIRRIASMLGCAVGSIYRYFADKRDLLLAVAEASLGPATRLIEAGGSVEASARLYLEHARRDPALYHLAFWLARVAAAGRGNAESETPDETPARPAGWQAFAAESLTIADGGASVAMERRRSPRVKLGAGLPDPVRRLVDGWGKRLGDANLAVRCWTTLHGCVTLGLDDKPALEAVCAMLAGPTGQTPRAHAAAAKDGGSRRTDIGSAETKTLVDATEAVEDVCLL